MNDTVDLTAPPPLGICSYNVLCEQTRLVCDFLYHMNAPGQKWIERWPRIQQDILSISTDIFCLQECQDDHFLENFEPMFVQSKRDLRLCVD